MTVALLGGSALLVAAMGLPTKSTDPAFVATAWLTGFAFCAGQGAAVTGFLAMKQKENPLYVLPALVGAALGVGAFVALLGFSMFLGVQQSQAGFR